MRISFAADPAHQRPVRQECDTPRRILHALHLDRRQIQQRLANALRFFRVSLPLLRKLNGRVRLRSGHNRECHRYQGRATACRSRCRSSRRSRDSCTRPVHRTQSKSCFGDAAESYRRSHSPSRNRPCRESPLRWCRHSQRPARAAAVDRVASRVHLPAFSSYKEAAL